MTGAYTFWDVAKRQLLLDRDIENEGMSALAFGDDLKRFVGWDWIENRVVLGDVTNAEGSLAFTVPWNDIPQAASFSRDGTHAMAVERTGHGMRTRDTRTGELAARSGSPARTNSKRIITPIGLRPALSADGPPTGHI